MDGSTGAKQQKKQTAVSREEVPQKSRRSYKREQITQYVHTETFRYPVDVRFYLKKGSRVTCNKWKAGQLKISGKPKHKGKGEGYDNVVTEILKQNDKTWTEAKQLARNKKLLMTIMSVYGEKLVEYESGGADITYLGDLIFKKPNNLSSLKVHAWKSGDEISPEYRGTYAEGDILFPKYMQEIYGSINTTKRWLVGVVPYEIDEFAFTEIEKFQIVRAMDEFRYKSCIRFLIRQADDDSWIEIKGEKQGCYSAVGRINGRQVVNLEPPQCLRFGTILHEFMHVLGFGHENARSDRDEYVTIYPDNIEKDRQSNFYKSFDEQSKQLGTYDYNSIMHYPSTAFSKNGINTIMAKDKRTYLNRVDYFSDEDISKLVKMYHCRSLGTSKFLNKVLIFITFYILSTF